jgi:hypothetical protein
MTGEEWLRKRLPAAPRALLEAMVAALPENALLPSEAMARGSAKLYEQVIAGATGREAALPLLAADALLTHAFEARAEEDPATLAEFAERWGVAGEFARMAERCAR